MKPLVFSHRTLKSGLNWPNQWISDCGRYSMARYKYMNGDKCKPYYMGYLLKATYCWNVGRRLTSEKGMTKKEVIAILNKHAEENT